MADFGLKNVANITYDYQPDPNVESVESGEIQSNSTNDSVDALDIRFEKTTCDTAVPKGGLVDYTLLAVNQGTVSLNNMVIDDDLPIVEGNYNVNYVANSVTATVNGVLAFVEVNIADPHSENKPQFTVEAPPAIKITQATAGVGGKLGTIDKIGGEGIYEVALETNFGAGDKIKIGSTEFEAVATGATAGQFNIGASEILSVTNLETAYNATPDAKYGIVQKQVEGADTNTLIVISTAKPIVSSEQTAGDSPLTLAAEVAATGMTYNVTVGANHTNLTSVTIGDKTLEVTAEITPAAGQFKIGDDAVGTAANIAEALVDAYKPTGYNVTNNGAIIALEEDPQPIAKINPEDAVLIQFKGKVPVGNVAYVPAPAKTIPGPADPLLGKAMVNTAKLGFAYTDSAGTAQTVAPGATANGGKIATTVSEIHQAELWAAKALGVTNPVKKGSVLKYTFTLTNKGDRPAENVTISDMLPDEFKVMAQTGTAVPLIADTHYKITTTQGTPTATVTSATLNTFTNILTMVISGVPAAFNDGVDKDGIVTIELNGKYKEYTA